MATTKKSGKYNKTQFGQTLNLIAWMSIAQTVCIYGLLPWVKDFYFFKVLTLSIPVVWMWWVYLEEVKTKWYCKILLWSVIFGLAVWSTVILQPLDNSWLGKFTHICAGLAALPTGWLLAKLKLFPPTDYLVFLETD